jgi:hypothetical protein
MEKLEERNKISNLEIPKLKGIVLKSFLYFADW